MEIKDYTEMVKAHQELREVHDKFQTLYETNLKMVQDMDNHPIIQMLTYVMETAKPFIEVGLFDQKAQRMYLAYDYGFSISKNEVEFMRYMSPNVILYCGSYTLKDGKWVLKTLEEDFRNFDAGVLADMIDAWPRYKINLHAWLENLIALTNKEMVEDAQKKAEIMKTIQEFKV